MLMERLTDLEICKPLYQVRTLLMFKKLEIDAMMRNSGKQQNCCSQTSGTMPS